MVSDVNGINSRQTGGPQRSGAPDVERRNRTDGDKPARHRAARVRASPIYLWCDDPEGGACELASEAVGVMPVTPGVLPAELLEGFDDMPNDCAQPETSELVERISRALDLDATGWADQVGTTLPVDLVPERYQGGGCITLANRHLPTVKIHARTSPGPAMFLVRIWEPEAR